MSHRSQVSIGDDSLSSGNVIGESHLEGRIFGAVNNSFNRIGNTLLYDEFAAARSTAPPEKTYFSSSTSNRRHELSEEKLRALGLMRDKASDLPQHCKACHARGLPCQSTWVRAARLSRERGVTLSAGAGRDDDRSLRAPRCHFQGCTPRSKTQDEA